MKNNKYSSFLFIATLLFIMFLMACASSVQPRQQAIQTSQTRAAYRPYSGPRSEIVVGDFNNRSSYMRGIFSDNQDRIGGQAKTILLTHLQQTNRFILLDRDNMEAARREAEILGTTQNTIGASYVVTGDVTEFGRRETSDMQLWGIIGSGRRQVAYAVVSVYVVDIRTSQIIYAAQGGGEVALNDRQILGFGTAAGYDSTLNGQVLDLAIREAVDSLAEGIDLGLWRP